MFILILFAFFAGFVTILSPCILPVLPIVLSGSLSGGKKRPLGIVTGFIASFTFFTLTLSAIVNATGLSADSLRTFAIFSIGLFGISLLIPGTQILLEKLSSNFTSHQLPHLAGGRAVASRSGFLGGILVGISIGLLWTPCVGPILASVITLALSGSTNLTAFFITLAYSLGTGIPMLAITYGGRQLLQKVPWLLANTAKIQKGFGVVMIAMAVAIFFNVDRQFQTIILKTFPSYGTGLTSLEDNAAVKDQLAKLGSGPTTYKLPATSSLSDLGPVPNPTFAGASHWVNSDPLNFQTNLQGKVVLIDFWTYSCINCIRTLPYLRSWYDAYKDKGFVIIGVHSPEFEFEKKTTNVTQAMKDLGVTWPVVQDNDLAIWQSYDNHYWPAHYLIDAKGHLRMVHFGEGKYKETEEAIQALLQERGEMDLPAVSAPLDTSRQSLFAPRLTPETYLGSERKDPSDGVTLTGDWKSEPEHITSQNDTSTLSLDFYAGKVFLVMGGKSDKPVTVKLDGKDIPVEFQTSDYSVSRQPPLLTGGQVVASRSISITADRKYDIVDLGGNPGRHTVELTVPSGISAYAFTFGE